VNERAECFNRCGGFVTAFGKPGGFTENLVGLVIGEKQVVFYAVAGNFRLFYSGFDQ